MCWHGGLPWCHQHWRKPIFPSPKGTNGNSFLIRDETLCLPLLLSTGICLAWTWVVYSCFWCICVPVMLYLDDMVSMESAPLLHIHTSLKGRRLIKIFYLELSAPKTPTFCTLSSCGFVLVTTDHKKRLLWGGIGSHLFSWAQTFWLG